MGWQDRDYYRDRPYGQGNPWMWPLVGSVPLFTVSGIRVRAHASLVIFIGLTILFSETSGGLGGKDAVVSMTILFGSVLLHEFGHCFAARWVGGSADDIMMTPIGGLAFAQPPHRPWPSFITTAGGPLVNVLICLLTGTALALLDWSSPDAIPWHPLRDGVRTYQWHDPTTYFLWWIFVVNFGLLIFNLLMVFYPFDGGRLVQEILWVFIGYYKSMRIAVVVGMVGAGVVAAYAIMFAHSLMLLVIAGFGFYACMRQRQVLLESGPYDFENEVDYSSSLRDTPAQLRKSRRAEKQVHRQAAQFKAERQRIDAILSKVSAKGMNSLNWLEKRSLRKATERQRRDTKARGY